jgi:hypothetical protein
MIPNRWGCSWGMFRGTNGVHVEPQQVIYQCRSGKIFPRGLVSGDYR